ncbi:MAG: MnmA/TRMU family protein, partial [Phycisphaerae bacterium]
MSTNRKKVVVAMSGGVDSSVAAALLKEQGYDCIGVFMRLGGDPDEQVGDNSAACSPEKASQPHHQGCCSTNDAADARYVAGLLGIDFYALNFQHDFGGIIDYFVREYNHGRTPNPCVRCNEYLKFGKLSRYARAIGADFVATGHYARIGRDSSGITRILRAVDHAKDQSYVLFGIPPEELTRMLLPIGHYPKSEVRVMARRFGLPVHDKPDSQEICFVPDNEYFNLVKRRSPETVKPGPIVDQHGKTVGTH